MGVSSGGQALDAFLREQFDVLQYVRDHMDSILRVANHLTPVEDLQELKDEIDAIYPRLGALVEASDLILSASEAGIILLQAIDAPAQRAALQLGSAALRSEESLADASALANTNSTLTALSTYVDTVAANLASKVSQADFNALTLRLDNIEDGLVARISTLINEIWESDFLDQVNTKVTVVSSELVDLTTRVDAQVVRIDEMTITVNGMAPTIANHTTQITNLTGRVTTLENWKAVTAIQVAGLQSQITTLTGALTEQGNTIGDLDGRTSNVESVAALTEALAQGTQLRIEAAEATLAAEVMARTELTDRVDANEATIEYFNGRLGDITSSLSSGGNLLWNAGFESSLANWTLFSIGTDWDAAVMDRDSVTQGQLKALRIRNTSGNVPTTDTGACSSNVPVQTGQSYIVSGYIGASNCTARLEYRFLDALLQEVGYGLVAPSITTPPASLKDWPRQYSKLLIPEGVAFIQVQVWAVGVSGVNPTVWLCRPMVEEASEEQTNPSPWVPGAGGLSSEIADQGQDLSDQLSDQAQDIADEIQDRIDGDIAVSAAASANLAAEAAARTAAIAGEASARSSEIATAVAASAAVMQAQVDALTAQIGDIYDADAHDPTLTYPKGQLVKSGGKLYRALQAVPVDTPITNTAYWFLLGDYSSLGEAVAANLALSTTTAGDVAALTTTVTTHTTRLDNAEANLETIQQAYTDADTALANDISNLESTVNNPTTGVTATAAGLSGLTTRVDNNEDAISTQATQLTNLQGIVNDPTTGLAAAGAAIDALETRVTSNEGTLTAQGNSITSLSSSISNKDFLSGNGTNLLWSEYTRFINATVPQNNKSVVTLACVALAGSAGGYVLQGTTGGTVISADWAYLGASATDYNLPLPAGKYIVSFEAKANVAGHKILFQIKGSNGVFYSVTGGDITLTAAMARYSGVVTLPAGVTAAEVLIYFNRSGVSGRIVQFDRLMIESQVGSGTTPSTWVPGPTNRQTDSANTTIATKADASALTALTTRVTATEGANTSQSTQITNLENTVNNATTGVVATATGLSSLITTVTSQGDTITSQGSAITALQNELHNPTTGLAATVSALDGLTTTVTSQGTAINAVADRTTALETTVNTTHANALSDLGTRVTATEDAIDTQAADIVSLGTDVDALESTVSGHSTALSSLGTRTTAAEGSIVSQGTAITNLQNQVGGIEDDVAANAGAISSLNTTVSQQGTLLEAAGADITAIQAGLGAVLGPELIPNWNFAAGVTGVTNGGGATFTAANGILTVTAADGSADRVEWIMAGLTVGATYRFQISARRGAQGTTQNIQSFTIGTIEPIPIAAGTEFQTYDVTFEATATSGRIRVYVASTGGAAGDKLEIDWISLKQVTNTSTADAINALDVRVVQNFDSIVANSSAITALQNTVNNPTTGVAATASALGSLTTRVTTAEGSITSQGARVTALENTVNNPTTGVAATASAVSTLDTRVDATEAGVTSNSNNITTLQNAVNSPTTGLAANASAISTLTSTVTAQGDEIEGITADVTALQNAITDPATGLAANASGINSLTTRVTTAEGNITSITTDLTALENIVEDPTTGVAANASAVDALDARVETSEDDITALTSAITDLLITANDPQTGINATATGLNALGTQVTTLDGAVDTLSSEVTALQNAVADPITGLAATSEAINTLTSRVTSAEGVNTSQGTDITTLQNTISDPTNGLNTKASTTITNALDSRVSAAEGVNTAQGSAITTINSRLDDPTTGLAAKASVTGLNALTTRVTETENDIDALGTSITSLSSTVAGKATTTALDSLTTRVSTAEGSINSLSTSLLALQSGLTDANTNIAANSSAITSLQTSVSSKNKVFYQAAQPTTGMIKGDGWVDSDDSNRYYIYSGTSWVDASASGITVFSQATAPSTTGRKVGDLWIETDANNKLWRWSGSAWVDASDPRIAANSSAITALQSTVNNPTTGVTATATALSSLSTRVEITEDGLAIAQAGFAFVLDVNGKVAGMMGLNDGTISTLTFNFDEVNFVSDDGSTSISGGVTVYKANGYMSVLGAGFGANGDLMRWYGTQRSVSTCTKANAISYEDTTGHVFVPSITVGDIVYFANSSTNTTPQTLALTATDTNGDTKVITCTYAFGAFRSNKSGAMPTGSATLQLWRKVGTGSFTQLGSTKTCTFVGEVFDTGDTFYDVSLQGELTFTYNDTEPTLAPHTYEWRLTSRTTSNIGSFGNQNMTLKSVES